mgnify:CR=1 FL=1
MADTSFTGDRKEPMVSPTAAIEQRFVRWAVPRVPAAIGSHHLTLMTLAWSALLVLAGWLAAAHSIHWLWLSSLMLFMQWLTDSLDGSVGRMRNAGLRRWGYYMDHFLDYVFMACVMGHYAFLYDGATRVLFLLLVPLYAAFEVNSWLEYGATGRFRITFNGVGPTEVRLLFVLINTALVCFGTVWLAAALPWAMVIIAVLLVTTVVPTQRRIWKQDMEEKKNSATDE